MTQHFQKCIANIQQKNYKGYLYKWNIGQSPMHYRRVLNPNTTYFITVNVLNRNNGLLIKHIDILRDSFQRVRQLHPFELIGVVILPDHFHMMINLPDGNSNYSLRIRLIKALFSCQLPREEMISLSRKNQGERGIWQRRFWEHAIRDEKDYENHLNYIHYNPVKHGYVQNATDWPYSSIHRFIKAGLIPKDWGFRELENGVYGEY